MEKFNTKEEAFDYLRNLVKNSDGYVVLPEPLKIKFISDHTEEGNFIDDDIVNLKLTITSLVLKFEYYDYNNTPIMNLVAIDTKLRNWDVDDYFGKTYIEMLINLIDAPKAKDYLDTILVDDNTAYGGVSFHGETLRDFIDEIVTEPRITENTLMPVVNKALRECGIKEIDIE